MMSKANKHRGPAEHTEEATRLDVEQVSVEAVVMLV